MKYAREVYGVVSESLRVAARFVVKVFTAGLIIILTEKPGPATPSAPDPRHGGPDTDEFWR